MNDLLSTLRDIQSGLANPGLREIAGIAQELLIKQVRQSWEGRHGPNMEEWAGLKRPSYAGFLKTRRGQVGSVDFNLLHYKETGERVYEKERSFNPTDAFIAHNAVRAIRDGSVSDKGFETHAIKQYGLWQSDGTDKTGWGPPIPARPFWAFGDDLLDLVADLLADRAAKAVAA